MVNLFGATGYIGTVYQQRHPVIIQARDDLIPQHNKILYMISTNHNHHLPNNVWIDVDTNITLLLRVLERCRELENAEFNFVSSWFVYGDCDKPATENSLCDPRGFYSVTKRTAEQLLQEYCACHGIPWRILRLCNVVGGHDISSSRFKNALHSSLLRLITHQDVQLAASGSFYRNYLHVQDVCDAINFVINDAPLNEIFNIASDQSVTMIEIMDFAQRCIQSRSQIHQDPSTPVINCFMDNSRLRDLGWRGPDTWQHTIQRVIQDLQHQVNVQSGDVSVSHKIQ